MLLIIVQYLTECIDIKKMPSRGGQKDSSKVKTGLLHCLCQRTPLHLACFKIPSKQNT
jgi:hypothetical protein